MASILVMQCILVTLSFPSKPISVLSMEVLGFHVTLLRFNAGAFSKVFLGGEVLCI